MGWNKGKSAVQDWMRAHLEFPGGKCLLWPFTKNWNGYGLLAEIIALKGVLNQRQIAAKFGISYQHVSVIQQGKLVRQRKAG